MGRLAICLLTVAWMGCATSTPPKPAVFVSSTTIDVYPELAGTIRQRGYHVEQIDPPCREIADWVWWVRQSRDPAEQYAKICTRRLDDLIAGGTVDPGRVYALGISRDAYQSLTWSAKDGRVRRVAMLAPLSDLGQLSEFQGVSTKGRLLDLAPHLGSTRIAVWISTDDRRVSTPAARRFAEEVKAECHEYAAVPGTNGHDVTPEVLAEAVDWLTAP